MKAHLLAISRITQMPPSSRVGLFLRWVLFAAAVIILLGHACVPLTGGHAEVLSLVMGGHHTPDDSHHETHLASCEQAPVESRGSSQALSVDQACDVTATSIDWASIFDAILSISYTAIDPNHLPIFLLHTTFLI
jgi:hypothetical protein